MPPPSRTPDAQSVLDHVAVRLLRPGERGRFDQLLIAEHYLHSADLVGEQLRYVAAIQGAGARFGGEWIAKRLRVRQSPGAFPDAAEANPATSVSATLPWSHAPPGRL